MYTDLIIGGVLLCLVLWVLSKQKKDTTVDRFQEDILNSDKYKVKGKFGQ
jgi:hypothetical protein